MDHSVVVIFKNQLSGDPANAAHVGARRHAIASLQSSALSSLSHSGARGVHAFTTIDALSATVSNSEESALESDPQVAEVIPNVSVPVSEPQSIAPSLPGQLGPSAETGLSLGGFGAAPPNVSSPAAAGTGQAGQCLANPNKPQLAPEAIETINADSDVPGAKTARHLGYDGSGVSVGVIADHVDPDNPDLIRADGSHVVTDYKAFGGLGTAAPGESTEAFLDISSIAAQGRLTYNIAGFGALAPSCEIRIEGVAPGADVDDLDSGDYPDYAWTLSQILDAIDYAVTVDHVAVLNLSVAINSAPDEGAALNAIRSAVDQAVAAGVTVVVGSGDGGFTDPVEEFADDPNVISAGASTTYKAAVQIGDRGAQMGVSGWLDDNISSISTSEIGEDGQTLSLVAPGEENWILCSADTTQYPDCGGSDIGVSGGTSEAAPLVSGTAALVIQAYAEHHHGTRPTPAVVKQIITGTADDINAPGDMQGAGRLDAYRAVLAAQSYGIPVPPSTPAVILPGTSQLDATGLPGSRHTFTEALTNTGGQPATVSLSSRVLGPYRTIASSTVTLDDGASPHAADPHYVQDNYEAVRFKVPSGVDRLDASIAFQAFDLPNYPPTLTLVDPSGKLADSSWVETMQNDYGEAQVAEPTPGTWTAYIYDYTGAVGGFTGQVVFGARVASFQTLGTVSPSKLTIPAWQTRSVGLSATSPATPGDEGGSLVISPAGQTPTTVPVALRTLIPTPTHGQTSQFSELLTGGNGRDEEVVTGPKNYYEIDVPAGTPELNASIRLADPSLNPMFLWLVDPSGQVQATATSLLPVSAGVEALQGAVAHVLNPTPGRWTVITVFGPFVSGTTTGEPYTVSVDLNPVKVSSSGIPQGQTASVTNPINGTVTVTNTTNTYELYFLDPRLSQSARYALPVGTGDLTVPVPEDGGVSDLELPTLTTSLTVTASTTGATPIRVDVMPFDQNPYYVTPQGINTQVTATGDPLTAGPWELMSSESGAEGTVGAASEDVQIQASMITRGFDEGVTSSTGGGESPFTPEIAPVLVAPGATTTMQLSFAPTGPAGTTVAGDVYLDDESLFSGLEADEAPDTNILAAIPYRYRIGR